MVPKLTIRRFEIVDQDQIPKHLWVIDKEKLAKAVQVGNVPGCKIWEEEVRMCTHCPCYLTNIMRCCDCKEIPRGAKANGKPNR